MEKVLPPLYQHPFVDVFGKFKLFEDKQVSKEGDVIQTIDKKLGKKIYKIQGSTSASNYIMTPSKTAKYKSLGLTGKYNYVIMRTQTGKLFSTHLDYIVNEKHLVRVSLSNIFKETKVTGSSIQIPISEIEPLKWTIVQVNIFSILDENNMFSKSAEEKKFYLRSFQVCSNQFIRGLATSDIEYSVNTFPKELSLKCKRNEEWFKEFGWINIGKMEQEEAQSERHEPPKKSDKSKRPKSALRHTTGKKNKNKLKETQDKKKVSFTLGKNEQTTDRTHDNQENMKDIANFEDERNLRKEHNMERDIEESKSIQDELYRVRDNSSLIERTRQEIDDIRQQYEMELHGKSAEDYSVNNNEKLLMQRQPDPRGSADPSDVFVLKPDPIMRLNQ